MDELVEDLIILSHHLRTSDDYNHVDFRFVSVRNKDLTWPEELSQMAKNKAVLEKGSLGINIHKCRTRTACLHVCD